MQISTLEDLFSNPSFLCLFFTILVVIGNIMIGVSILPRDKRKRGYRWHRYVYFLVLAGYAAFLAFNHFLQGNSIFEYMVLVYFLALVPLTQRIHVTLHAIISSIGLVLLMIVVLVGIL